MQPREFARLGLIIVLVWLVLMAAPLAPQPLELKDAGEKLALAAGENDFAEQAAQYRRILAYQPWRSSLELEIGRLELLAGNLDAGIASLNALREKNLLTPSDLIALGDAYRDLGQPDQAAQAWAEAVSRGEVDAQVYLNGLTRQLKADDLAAARSTAAAWLKDYPADVKALAWNGLLLAGADPQRSAGLLTQAAGLDAAYAGAADLLVQAAEDALANEDASYRLLVMGRALGSLNEWQLAEEAFQQAVQLSPGYAEAWALLGQATLQNSKDGLPALQRAEELNPQSVIVRTALAIYWRSSAEPQKALEYLAPLAEQYMNQCIWQVELGRTYAQMGVYDTALAYFQRSVEVEPANADCWRELAVFSVTQELDIEFNALPAARQVLALQPGEASAYDLMGWTLLAQKDYPNSEKFFLKALEIQETYAPAHLHLAHLYFLQGGHTDQAIEHLERVIEMNPESAYADSAETMLKEYTRP